MSLTPVDGTQPRSDSAPSGVVHIGLVDDHPVVLRGIIAAVADVAPDISVDFLVTSLRDLDWARASHPDVVLLDIDLNDGTDAATNLRTLLSYDVRVLLFTAERRPALLRRLVLAGAMGLALKSDPEDHLVDAIRQVARGEFATSSHFAEALLTDEHLMATLAPREREVLEQLAAGVPKKAIGRSLSSPVATSTVDTYFQRIATRYAALDRPVGNIYGSLREAAKDGHIDL